MANLVLKLFEDIGKDESKAVIRDGFKDVTKDLSADDLKVFLGALTKDQLKQLIPRLGEDTLKDIFRKIGKDGVHDMFLDIGGKDLKKIFKQFDKEEIRDLLGDEGKDLLKRMGIEETGDISKGAFAEMKDEMKDDMKEFKFTKTVKYAIMGWFGYKTVMALNTQSASECLKKCVAGTNTDNPDSNCDTSTKSTAKALAEKECALQCKVSAPGKCSAAKRKENAEDKCAGAKIVECAAGNTSDWMAKLMGFFSEYGDYILTFVWIVIGLAGVSLLYKFLKMFTTNKYSKATDWVTEKAGGDPGSKSGRSKLTHS